jgi:hypothetical protein
MASPLVGGHSDVVRVVIVLLGSGLALPATNAKGHGGLIDGILLVVRRGYIVIDELLCIVDSSTLS